MKRAVMIKICPQCKREFETTSINRKYCCKFCADKFNHERYRKEGRTQKLREKRKKRLGLEQKAKQKKLKIERLDAIAKMQAETGIGAGYLKLYWHDKSRLNEYIRLHRKW